MEDMRYDSKRNPVALSALVLALAGQGSAQSLFDPGQNKSALDIASLTEELSHKLLNLDKNPNVSYKDLSNDNYRVAEVQLKIGSQLYHIVVAEPRFEGVPIMDLQTRSENGQTFGVSLEDYGVSGKLLMPHPDNTARNAFDAQVYGVTNVLNAVRDF